MQDEAVLLQFFRCDGQENRVTTTIKIDRPFPADPIFVLEVFIKERFLPFLCPYDDMIDIEENGRTFGRVAFPDSMCRKAVIVTDPPPAVRIRLTVHVNNTQAVYGPYFIGQEGECGF